MENKYDGYNEMRPHGSPGDRTLAPQDQRVIPAFTFVGSGPDRVEFLLEAEQPWDRSTCASQWGEFAAASCCSTNHAEPRRSDVYRRWCPSS